MGFVKILKNKAYFKRYQTKLRRRREGKTDYYARKRLIIQAKNKYNTPKYRLVVRITNRQIIAQIVAAEIIGDRVVCVASSAELPRYGVECGLTNYPAAYCTGLLCARRLLTKYGLADMYKGNVEVTGEIKTCEGEDKQVHYVTEVGEKRPFRCYLDVGLRRTTTGARIFAVLKGCNDGGVDIPHNEKRFYGYSKQEKSYDAEANKNKIFGQPIAEYMKDLKENNDELYQKQFSRYIKNGISGDMLEDIYKKAHKAIREHPEAEKKENRDFSAWKKYAHPKKLTYEERKQRVAEKKAAMQKEE
jgi:large subunit ribosomal protein L5e